MCTNEILSFPLVANLMERNHSQSSSENSPSDEGGHGGDGDSTPSKALAEDVVVSSSFAVVPTEVGIVPSFPQGISSGRKRGRIEEKVGESSSGGGQKSKKGELTDPPSSDPKCATCGKTFGSWKAVFGHLRSHPEREYRGAFPPPKIWEEMLQEAARQQHGRDQGSRATEMEGLSGGDVGRGIGIDLNAPEEPHKDGFPFDLNMPAPENESEEEDDNNDS